MSAFGSRCLNCNVLETEKKKADASKPCPECKGPREACFIGEPCEGECTDPVFHHPSGVHFWCFTGFVAPGVPECPGCKVR